MDLLTISILTGLFITLALSTIYDIFRGDRGKRNNASNLFRILKGDTAEKEKTDKIRRLNISDKFVNRYIYFAIPICVMIFFISLLSFKSIGMALCVSLFGLLFPKIMYNRSLKKKRDLINYQLKDALNSITSSLKAGLSINSALVKCTDELEKMYSYQKEKPMLEEFKKIRNELSMGVSVDDVLRNFKERVKTEDIDDFANSIIIVRQKGGNLVDVVENVSGMIKDKIEIKREIDRLTSAKKTEAKILSFLPVFLIVSLSIFSPEYMQPLYSTLFGKIIIIIGFIMLIVNYFIGKRIVDIQV